jgi:hypothetical protein
MEERRHTINHNVPSWECGDCRRRFYGHWRKICPACRAVGFWSGSMVYRETDPPPDRDSRQSSLLTWEEQDAKEAQRRKREAMDRVERNARKEWNKAAYHAVIEIARVQEKLNTDPVWALLAKWEIPPPRQGKAMGPVMRRAAKDGIIEDLDDKRLKTIRPSQNASKKTTWHSKIFMRPGVLCSMCARGRRYCKCLPSREEERD